MKNPFNTTAKVFGVTEKELRGKATYPPLPDARHALCMALYELGHSNRQIEKMLGYEQSRVAQSLRIARGKAVRLDFTDMVIILQKLLSDEPGK